LLEPIQLERGFWSGFHAESFICTPVPAKPKTILIQAGRNDRSPGRRSLRVPLTLYRLSLTPSVPVRKIRSSLKVQEHPADLDF